MLSSTAAATTRQMMISRGIITPQIAKFTTACARAFPNEPKPNVQTAFPAPETLAFKDKMNMKMCTLATHFPVDLRKSLGNIVMDADGNRMLDVFCSIGTNAMGYNHPRMLATAGSDLMNHTVATRTGIGINPIKEQHNINEEAFMTVAPPGMERVTAAMCGTCANEGAIKVAMMAYKVRKDGGEFIEPTPDELCSCMVNQAPGSPNYTVLSLR